MRKVARRRERTALDKLKAVAVVLAVVLAVAIMAAPSIQERYGPLQDKVSFMLPDRSPQ
jgi:hypothetical protein